MNWFVNNREVIKELAINTGTSDNQTYTKMCTTSEITVNTELEQTDFYVFCDALQRHLITGANISLDTTVKMDMNNVAIMSKVHTLLSEGTVAQFNNVSIKFDLLDKVENNVLTYKTYKANASLDFSDLGGAAEEEGEFSLTISINGKAVEE